MARTGRPVVRAIPSGIFKGIQEYLREHSAFSTRLRTRGRPF